MIVGAGTVGGAERQPISPRAHSLSMTISVAVTAAVMVASAVASVGGAGAAIAVVALVTVAGVEALLACLCLDFFFLPPLLLLHLVILLE